MAVLPQRPARVLIGIALLSSLWVMSAFLHGTFAQPLSKFPRGRISLIIPSAPGGFLDIAGRIIAQDVSKRTGSTITVDFRDGAGGAIGLIALKQAAPDGHTLLEGNSGPNVINPVILPNLSYDPIKDFVPLTTLVYTPTVFVVPSSSPAKTLADLVALADKRPEGLSFGSAGVGTSSHLVGEMLRVVTRKNMVHVPYGGTGPMVIDLVAGRLDFTATSFAAVHPLIEAGELRPLAVPGASRIAQLPNVPTTAEAGFPTVKLDYWSGLFAPAGTPSEIAQAVSGEFNKTLRDAKVIKTLEDRGLIAEGNTPSEFKMQLVSELQNIRDVVKAAGIAPLK